VYVYCNTTGWITTKLRWFTFKPLHFIYRQLLKYPKRVFTVPTEIRKEVLFLPNWVLCNFILIIVHRDATQSSLFIMLQVHSTCFGYQIHPSSGVHKTVTTASGTGHILCAATSLQRGQPHPSSGEHKTVTTASGTVHAVLCSYLPPTWPSVVTLEGGSCTAQRDQYRRL